MHKCCSHLSLLSTKKETYLVHQYILNDGWQCKDLHNSRYSFVCLDWGKKEKREIHTFFSKLGSSLSVYIHAHSKHTCTHTPISIQQHRVIELVWLEKTFMIIESKHLKAQYSMNLKGWEERTWSRGVKLSVPSVVNWKLNQSYLKGVLLSSVLTILYLLFLCINDKLQTTTAPEKVLKHTGSIGVVLINISSLSERIPPSFRLSVFKCAYLWKQTYHCSFYHQINTWRIS